eukprot:1356432-Amorphochlora_amoeboformis.AAC.2
MIQDPSLLPVDNRTIMEGKEGSSKSKDTFPTPQRPKIQGNFEKSREKSSHDQESFHGIADYNSWHLLGSVERNGQSVWQTRVSKYDSVHFTPLRLSGANAETADRDIHAEGSRYV